MHEMRIMATLREQPKDAQIARRVYFTNKQHVADGSTYFMNLVVGKITPTEKWFALYHRTNYQGLHEDIPAIDPSENLLCARIVSEVPNERSPTAISNFFSTAFDNNPDTYQIVAMPGDESIIFMEAAKAIPKQAPLEKLVTILKSFGIGLEQEYRLPTFEGFTIDLNDNGGNVLLPT